MVEALIRAPLCFKWGEALMCLVINSRSGQFGWTADMIHLMTVWVIKFSAGLFYDSPLMNSYSLFNIHIKNCHWETKNKLSAADVSVWWSAWSIAVKLSSFFLFSFCWLPFSFLPFFLNHKPAFKTFLSVSLEVHVVVIYNKDGSYTMQVSNKKSFTQLLAIRHLVFLI